MIKIQNAGKRKAIMLAVMGITAVSAAAFGLQQIPPIGIVDFYGNHNLSSVALRKALGIKEGDAIPDDTVKAAAATRLKALPGVQNVHISGVCCDAGRAILYVGIQEVGGIKPAYRPAPTGNVRLPQELIAANRRFEKALIAAAVSGDLTEDDSQGHALAHNPDMRAVQQGYLHFASEHFALLRDVLMQSSDAHHRALAAQVVGYSSDKRAAADCLLGAVNDADEEVRNNATRAIGVIANYANSNPEKQIRISPDPFIEMVNSPIWTDRNKGTMGLMMLTQKPDSAVYAAIRKKALPALTEMANWKSTMHNGAPRLILERVKHEKE